MWPSTVSSTSNFILWLWSCFFYFHCSCWMVYLYPKLKSSQNITAHTTVKLIMKLYVRFVKSLTWLSLNFYNRATFSFQPLNRKYKVKTLKIHILVLLTWPKAENSDTVAWDQTWANRRGNANILSETDFKTTSKTEARNVAKKKQKQKTKASQNHCTRDH